jgi:hypothetical protein
LLGCGAGQLLAGPAELAGGDAAGAGIPHEKKHVVLNGAVVEREVARIHKLQAQGLASRLPEAAHGGPIGLKAWRAVVIAHGRQEGQAGLAHRREHRAGKALPHPIQLAGAQAPLLAGHHVAGAHHQGRFQGEQLPEALAHLGDVAGGAVAAVEVADQAEAQIGGAVGGRRGRLLLLPEQPPGTAACRSRGGELKQLAAAQAHGADGRLGRLTGSMEHSPRQRTP